MAAEIIDTNIKAGIIRIAFTHQEGSATLGSDTSAGWGLAERVVPGKGRSFFVAQSIATLSPENKSDKPREFEGRALKSNRSDRVLDLSHRLITAQGDGIGIVYDPVTDGISDQRISDLVVPAMDLKLRTEDSGT